MGRCALRLWRLEDFGIAPWEAWRTVAPVIAWDRAGLSTAFRCLASGAATDGLLFGQQTSTACRGPVFSKRDSSWKRCLPEEQRAGQPNSALKRFRDG